MIYTEKEAEDKGCPIVSGRGGAGYVTCSGSRCMAWRWVMATKDNFNGAIIADRDDGSVVFPDRAKKEYTKEPPASARGYCGLAGGI